MRVVLKAFDLLQGEMDFAQHPPENIFLFFHKPVSLAEMMEKGEPNLLSKPVENKAIFQFRGKKDKKDKPIYEFIALEQIK